MHMYVFLLCLVTERERNKWVQEKNWYTRTKNGQMQNIEQKSVTKQLYTSLSASFAVYKLIILNPPTIMPNKRN